ncbi:MAG: VWA domain-containing protein [Myxococcota bacterium]
MRRIWTAACALALSVSCSDDGGLNLAPAGDTTSGTTPPAPLCQGGGPLEFGDAPWVKAPLEPPGDMGDGSDDGDDDDGGDETGSPGGGFIDNPDGGGTSFECDLFAQDCPEGEKCMPWSNDGGKEWNATRCSPVSDMPGSAGDTCMAEGNGFSGIDDCDLGKMCWDVDRANAGSCVTMCTGDEANPECPGNQWCYIGFDGSVSVCMPPQLCAEDGACQCMCPEGQDPDCSPDQCMASTPDERPDELVSEPPVHADGEAPMCPETTDPVVLYMSNDDSGSQASPIIARRTISEGYVIAANRIRIHEFLNYFDLNAEPQTESPADLGIEMRRTDADLGEFTLVLRAQGKALEPDDRPPMNVVFSLDTSGSMQGEPMELLQDSMTATVSQLRSGDIVSVVTWNDQQSVELEGYEVTGPDDPELVSVITGLMAGGSTNLHAGLVTAYSLANTYHIDDGINRVVLISDGGANAGVTDLDLISSEAADGDGEGTYMVGVGVGTSQGYRDDLMDRITDAGKGSYVYIDRPDEAFKQLGDRFLANMAVSARNVRMRLTLPWYFGLKRFHGEEISTNPEEVEPQHLAPNDTMTFHQIISACDPSLITTCDVVTAHVDYVDPLTGEEQTNEVSASIENLVQQDVPRLYKADVVVGYAKALVVISTLVNLGQNEAAVQVAADMQQWADQAANELEDVELQEIADIMGEYTGLLSSL